MQLPGIEQQKIMLADQIAFLEDACINGIDPMELQDKLFKEIRHMFRSAHWKHQMDYFYCCNEAIENLKLDGSRANCKLMMNAIIYNLKCHLDYLNLKFPDK